MPATLEKLGLIAAMKEALGRINKTGDLKTELQTVNDPFDLPKDISLGLLRIFQELLQNTIKHAGASEVNVVIEYHSDQIRLHYTDNGKGLDPKGKKPDGIGMKNMESRVQAMEGTFHLNKKNRIGFEAKIEVPLVSKESKL
jgi:signal transduction histidine kinase